MLGIGKREKDGKKLTVFGNLSGGGDSYHTVWKHGCNINIKVPDVRMVEGILIALAQTVVLVKNKKGGRKYGIIWKDI